jgi:OmpA-OmpF porin, OOP family
MRTTRRQYLPLACTAAITLVSASAQAQTTPAPSQGEFSIQRFEPAAGSKNYLTVEGDRMEGNWGWTGGLFFNYSRNPFVVQSCASQTDCTDKNAIQQNDVGVVRDMFTWDLVASLSPKPWLQLGLRAPFSYVSGDGIDLATGTPAAGGLKMFGVGDPDIEGKFRLFGGPKSPFVGGGAVDVSFPVGNATAQGAYIGNSSPITVGVRGIFDGSVGPLSFAANLRGLFREDATIGTTTIGPEFRYSAALGYRISPIFRVIGEGYGGTRFSSSNGTNSLEADGAFEISPLDSGITFKVGGGAGIIQGVGVPAGRVLAGIVFAHEDADTDGDGIIDRLDKCPTIPEDKDGFEDFDGCPDPDNDADGIPDERDRCPNQPETINGYQDEDGCPDTVPDRDHDGIPDSLDKCPDDGGPDVIRTPSSKYYGCPDRDHDGVPDYLDKCPDVPAPTDDLWDGSGCPHVRDTDGDGIPDDVDACPDVPGIATDDPKTNGCPIADRDHDGIPDDKDKCPDQPENYNGFEDADGCPDKGPSLVQVTDNEIRILQKVEFANGSDKIQGAASFKVLDAVVGVMKGHADIFLIEVAGHTDNVGPADQNRTLSQKRADAVVAYLKGKGISATRVQARGYGPDKPIADNKSGLGRQKNRRVEFTILQSAKKGGPGTPQPGSPVAPTPAPAAPAAAPAAPAKGKPKK